MRTARSLPYGGGGSPRQRPPGQRPPWTEIPMDRDPPDRDPRQRPPWTETPWTETPWTETETPLWTDKHLWKHYLPATSFAGGNKESWFILRKLFFFRVNLDLDYFEKIIFLQSELGSGDSDIDLDGEDLEDSDDEIEHGNTAMGGNPRARKKKQELEDSDNDF